MQINGEHYSFSQNYALFIPPGSCYRFSMGAPAQLLVFDFDPSCLFAHLQESLQTATDADFDPKQVLRYPLPAELAQPFSRFAPRLYEPLKQCTDEFLMEEPYYRDTASALIKYALIELIRHPRDTAANAAVSAVSDYIRSHYNDSSLNNQRIAQQFNYHPYHLSVLMKRATGKTLHEFLLDHRLKIAKNLLLTTELDVNTIAWKCGFNSTAYFIKQFKARIGTTPKQYGMHNTI